jgi:3-hydroxyacyl-CoA dehydrogenase
MTTPIPAYTGSLRTVGIIGAGTMAGQFAALFALRLDIPVLITDLDQDKLDHGLATVRSVLDRMVSRGKLDAERADQAYGRVRGTLNGEGFADADWVIEAVFEDLGVKQNVLAHYESLVGPQAILATNTSSLSVAEIGAKLQRPERLVGFHFFNPVAVMRLIEVVRTGATLPEVVATAVETAQALGKTPVVCTDTAGFIVNRVLTRAMAQAWQEAEAGVPVATIDRAVQPLGVPMSPFVLLSMVGPRVGGHVLESHRAALGERYGYGAQTAKVFDLDALYVTDEKGRAVGPTAEFVALFPADTDVKSEAEVTAAIAGAVGDEIGRMLAEGVVESEADIDTAMTLAAGYPERGITAVLRDLGVEPVAAG